MKLRAKEDVSTSNPVPSKRPTMEPPDLGIHNRREDFLRKYGATPEGRKHLKHIDNNYKGPIKSDFDIYFADPVVQRFYNEWINSFSSLKPKTLMPEPIVDGVWGK